MSEAKRYEGHCHCGDVKYSVVTDLQMVIECNCSHCAAKGFLLTFVPPEQFELLTGDESKLTAYNFNTHKIDHLFCPRCGVESFARGVGPDGKPMYAVNLRCVDGIETSSLRTMKVDGKNM